MKGIFTIHVLQVYSVVTNGHQILKMEEAKEPDPFFINIGLMGLAKMRLEPIASQSLINTAQFRTRSSILSLKSGTSALIQEQIVEETVAPSLNQPSIQAPPSVPLAHSQPSPPPIEHQKQKQEQELQKQEQESQKQEQELQQPQPTTISPPETQRLLPANCTVLQVKLLCGEKLPKMDLLGRANPFCKLSIGDSVKKSKICYGTRKPVWNETHTLYVLNKYL